jgi:hypothetical protein
MRSSTDGQKWKRLRCGAARCSGNGISGGRMQTALNCVARSITRPYIQISRNGVYVEIDDRLAALGELTGCARDRNRLAQRPKGSHRRRSRDLTRIPATPLSTLLLRTSVGEPKLDNLFTLLKVLTSSFPSRRSRTRDSRAASALATSLSNGLLGC